MKILIVGENINSILLAKYIKTQNSEKDIFITERSLKNYDFCTSLNIRESDIEGLLSFVKYNQIEFTIVMSELAIINGIAEEFQKEGFAIFAPFSQSSRATYFNSIAKKIMYKLKISTARFGIFDRENLAIDYVRNIKFPIIIENDFTLLERKSAKYETFSAAKTGIQKMFEDGNEKIVIEGYIDAPDVYLYFLTDGYSAYPLINLERTENERYILINTFSEQISDNRIRKILQNAIYPLLDDIAKFSNPYAGILGIKLKVYNNTFYISEFYNTFQKYDFQAFLSVLNENIFDLLYETANASIADKRNHIEVDNNYSYTIAVNKKFLNNNLADDENLFISEYNNYKAYTIIKPTLNMAKYELINILKSDLDKEIIYEIESKQKELVN